jgi:outer membrane protein assembly factor BamB
MATDQLLQVTPATAPSTESPSKVRAIRFWPMAVMLAAFWAYFIGNYWMELSQGQRFFSRLIAHAILFLGFLIWWLSRRGVPWRERWMEVAVFLLGSTVMLQLADPSIGIMSIFLIAAPFIFTGWFVILYLNRERESPTRRWWSAAWTVAVLSYFLFVRFEGIDGSQRNEMNWRWTPTAEQKFLEEHGSVFHAVANSPGAWSARPGDVTGFRGSNRDGILQRTNLATDWTAKPPKQIWRQRIGPAWSSVIVVDGRIVTHEQRGETEVVACYDADTGAEVWTHEDPVRFHEGLSGAGPRGTPTFDGGHIYALGGKGNLSCIDAASGKAIWTRDLVMECNATVPQWGFAVSPLVADGKVIVYANAKEGFGLIAFDAATGEQVWHVDAGGESYSSPQLIEIDGVRQIVMHDNRALRAVSVDDGSVLWERLSPNEMALPMLQPNVVGPNRLLASLDEGVTLLDVKQTDGQWAVEEVWTSNRLKPSFNDFVAHEGKVYGLDDGILCALDLESGERLWKKGRYGHGQILLLADQDALLVQGARGEVILIGISGEQPEELGRFEAIEGKTWNHPSLVGNRLYVRNGEEIACYELPAAN